ncbi:dihydrodipicolinate synthase family protein [Terrilactibacillus sp. BCM23-1]|uniref:Dihydrodipicolinate synthase family protein n=1 Tax=Terrilactibacillus tamarindi TaxID=2599694 RepID=A0A6N8CVL0_9BACI|nr:dihydrodipicolinate synthase family protein [Terrilactibacillus tamarindi]MTT32336.1 dihydrodipicolinate synthase family protein [Terrilactibacillus tamarindi]
MINTFPNGVWPVMLTPFTKENEVDYETLSGLIDWYMQRGVSGLFAVCQSSEMFELTREEREKIASFVKNQVNGKIPVIASGHVSDDFGEQLKDVVGMAKQGVDAVVLITNRLAKEAESDEVWKRNTENLLKHIPEDISLGLYECPFPYKRIMSPELLKWCAETGRFYFLKDTSCDIGNIKAKLEAVEGTQLKIYNANSATLLESIKLGAAGYSGIMANFHPELYVWLLKNWHSNLELAESLENFLSISSLIEKQMYPANAKYSLTLDGLTCGLYTRTQDYRQFSLTNQLEINQLYALSNQYKKMVLTPKCHQQERK